MKYVITGATSFIGLELIRQLLDNHHSIVAICRSGSSALNLIPQGVEIVYSEMSEYASLYQLIDVADVFVNLAWGGTGHDGRNVVDVQNENVDCTLSAFTSAVKMKCKLFVEAGSQAEYGSTLLPQNEEMICNPFSEYGKAKLKVKDELFKLSELNDIKYVHLRIFSTFGEYDHPWTLIMSSIEKMMNNEIVDLSPCTQNWNFVYVKDAVRQIEHICQYAIHSESFKHEVFNIASNDTRQLKDFVERLKNLVDSNSVLNFGSIVPTNFVSLQPDMKKTSAVVNPLIQYSFDEVVNIIKKNIYDKSI